jgi:hypothetical protein
MLAMSMFKNFGKIADQFGPSLILLTTALVGGAMMLAGA